MHFQSVPPRDSIIYSKSEKAMCRLDDERVSTSARLKEGEDSGELLASRNLAPGSRYLDDGARQLPNRLWKT